MRAILEYFQILLDYEIFKVLNSCSLIRYISSCFLPQSVWVRKGSLRWWRDWKPQRWVDVGVALEQSTRCDGRKDSIFFVYYTQYGEKKVSLDTPHTHVEEVSSSVFLFD